MTAGTEGFTYYGGNRDFLGDLVSKVLAARELAKSERNIAEQVAEQNQTSLEEAGISKGFFFRKALQHEFGGNYITDKKESVKNLFSKRKLLGEILTGKKSGKKISKTERVDAIFDLFKGGNKKSKVDRFLSRYKDIKGRYKAEIDDPMVKPQSPLVPNRRKKIKSATAGAGKRISKEQLFTALTSIVESLNKTAEALGKSTSEVSTGIIRSANSISDVAEQIKVRSSTIEDKLDTLISAINNQTQVQKQSADKAKDIIREKKVENIRDVSGTEAFDDLSTPEDETQNVQPTTQITNIQNVIPAATSAQAIEQQQMDAYNNQMPQAERGGIFSGPDSGYNVRLHGDEVVVPLDNNYTQGQPSAVDGIKRPKPRYERGTPGVTNNYSSVGGKFGFGITNMTGIAKGGTTQSSALAQPLVDAMSLSMMAAGGSILAATTNYISRIGGEGANIKPDLDRITRPIADVFGLPPSIVSKTKSRVKPAGTTKDKEKDGKSKSNIIAKMSEGFAKFLENMGEKINDPNDNPPPGGAAQPADITGNEKELLKRLMISEAGGEGIEGMAMVGQSVLNRASLIQSGTVGAGKFNAKSGSVTDVIQAPLQYQPYAQGKLNRALSSEENARAEEAYNLLMNMPEFKKRIKQAFNLTDKQVQFGAASTGFRNYDAGADIDESQQVNEFRAGRHTFNTAGNAGLRTASSDVKVEQPSATPTPPTSKKQLGQSITNNYGLAVGKERVFNHPEYGEIKAHKTRVGFDFYKGNVKLNMSENNPQAKSIVDYFTSTNGGDPDIIRQNNRNQFDEALERATQKANLQSSIAPPSDKSSVDKAKSMSSPLYNNDSGGNIVAMMMPPAQSSQNASTIGLPNAEDATIGQGIPDSGIRNAFYPTPIA